MLKEMCTPMTNKVSKPNINELQYNCFVLWPTQPTLNSVIIDLKEKHQ